MNDKQTSEEKGFKVNKLPTGLHEQTAFTEKFDFTPQAVYEYPNRYYI